MTNVGMREKLKVLQLVNDNGTESAMNAFSIQNVVKMGLVHNKFPGEWYGHSSVSLVFKDLNNHVFKPYIDFEVCLFSDGNVYLDKVKKLGCRKPRHWMKNKLESDEISDEFCIKLLFQQCQDPPGMLSTVEKKNSLS